MIGPAGASATIGATTGRMTGDRAMASGAAVTSVAMTAISDATNQPLESVRLFLDSRHGRHFADDGLNEMLRGQTIQQAIDQEVQLP